jgi:c-di-GMP-binding flagellar brake protein YcgR
MTSPAPTPQQGTQGVRKFPRINEPGLRGRLPVAARADLIDISLGGAGVRAAVPLSSTGTYRLRLRGSASASGKQSIERLGRLVWRHTEGTSPSARLSAPFRCGLSFDGPTGGGNGDLFEFIRDHGNERVTQSSAASSAAPGPERTATRYRLGALSLVTLETEIPYRVLTISLSGMLIGSAVPLRAEAKIFVVLELPKAEIRTAARVVSTELVDGYISECHVGLEFVGMQDDDRRLLEDYLRPLKS